MSHPNVTRSSPLNANNQDSTPHVRPFNIAWHGKTYAIANITDYHSFQENGQTIYVFSATDGNGSFELEFNSADMEWFLGV